MVGCELLVFKEDAAKRDRADLIVMDAQPSPAPAYQEAIDSRGVNDRDKRCVFDTADLAPPGIEYREPDEFGAIKHFLGNHRGPSISSSSKAIAGHLLILLQLVLQ